MRDSWMSPGTLTHLYFTRIVSLLCVLIYIFIYTIPVSVSVWVGMCVSVCVNARARSAPCYQYNSYIIIIIFTMYFMIISFGTRSMVDVEHENIIIYLFYTSDRMWTFCKKKDDRETYPVFTVGSLVGRKSDTFVVWCESVVDIGMYVR